MNKSDRSTPQQIAYRGCTFSPTRTTTDVTRYAYGRAYQSVAAVWEVEGRRSKPAGQRPWLVSARACREWIQEQDMLAEEV